MNVLTGNKVYLRALEAEDIDFLFNVENNTNFWPVSNTQYPFSKFLLKKYLDNAHQDIYESKQLRLVICKVETEVPVGLIDLFNFNPQHQRAGIGIVITEEHQHKGFARDALAILKKYCFNQLNLHQIYASVTEDNYRSIQLFKNHGFTQTGIRREWIFNNEQFKDELFFQLIKTE
ncbi:MAG: GNAT family N-acetyltransferase [Flavobacteriales bacterium]|nr:MAG: GNAT family N-acetyltransferase [Flavobacteriales bacterium]